VWNEGIREEVEDGRTIEDRVDNKRRMWQGYVRRVEGHRLQRQRLEWSPVGRCRRERRGGTWIWELMRERGRSEEDAEHREIWELGAWDP
jgi:hypothetical protein